ncbi:agamous-like MADS-box protein AGL80 [Euphorbia lathyris]|uniref:agamous-like MADS-box protein AGL80 n=1 Tax=Euphorbia lathyris TaxID=212925 RepID=UPI00331436FC
MTRKKTKIAWIANDTARKASLKKRRMGLCKKVQELTTLCGIKAFVIIYSPDEAEPIIWPSRSEVEEMMAKFQSIPEFLRFKKMMSQDSYLKKRVLKIQELTKKDSKKNAEVELSFLMNKLKAQEFDYNCLEPTETRYLTFLIGERREDIKKRLCYIEQTHHLLPMVQPGAEVAPLPPQPPSSEERVKEEAGVFRANPTDFMMWDQWFLDMVRTSDNVARGNPYFDLAITSPPNPNTFEDGVTPGDFGGSSSNANLLGFEPIQPPATVSSSATEEGLFGFLASESEVVGLPLPPNNSP